MANSDRRNVLRPSQRAALGALIEGATKTEAAAVAGCQVRTLNRWLDDPLFSAELKRHTTQALVNAGRRLTGVMDRAIDTIHEVLRDKREKSSVRLRAAQIAIDSGLRLIEAADIAERLERIEEILQSQNAPKGLDLRSRL